MSVDNRPLALTAKEYRILELLSLRKGTVLTKEMLLDHLYAGTDEPELKIIDVFVCKLRKKLAQATGGNHYIVTIWGRGYSLRDPTEAAVPKSAGRRGSRPEPGRRAPNEKCGAKSSRHGRGRGLDPAS
jgi:two-component system cell cycle response regulator CtrA